MRRVLVVITARPSYSRVKTVLEELSTAKDVQLFIMATASAKLRRFGNVAEQIQRDFPLNWMAGPSTVVEGDGTEETVVSTGLLTVQMGNHLAMMRPDVVVTIADRKETLATAIAASYQNIPLCHIQGGEVSGSIDDKVRNAVTQLADIHCVSTPAAARRVSDMRPGAVVEVTGCPGIDLARKALMMGPLPGKDIVVLQHPDATEPEAAKWQMDGTIEAVRPYADRVLWFWPGEDAGNEAMAKELRMAGVHPIRTMPPVEFLRTLLGSGVLVGNSSVGIRECSFLGVPVVNVGYRQRGRQRGPNVVDVGYTTGDIREALKRQMGTKPPGTHLYGDGHAGRRIAGLLMGNDQEAVA